MNINSAWLAQVLERVTDGEVELDDDAYFVIHTEARSQFNKYLEHFKTNLKASEEESEAEAYDLTFINMFLAGFLYREDLDEDAESEEMAEKFPHLSDKTGQFEFILRGDRTDVEDFIHRMVNPRESE